MKHVCISVALVTSFFLTGCATVADGMDWVGNKIHGLAPNNAVANIAADVHHTGASLVRGGSKEQVQPLVAEAAPSAEEPAERVVVPTRAVTKAKPTVAALKKKAAKAPSAKKRPQQ